MRTNILNMEKNKPTLDLETESKLVNCTHLIKSDYEQRSPPSGLGEKIFDDILDKAIYYFYERSAFARSRFRNKKSEFKSHIKRILNTIYIGENKAKKRSSQTPRKDEQPGYTNTVLDQQIEDLSLNRDSYY